MKMALTGTAWLAQAIINRKSDPSRFLKATPEHATWPEEKEDILERANWLIKKIVTSPEKLMKECPKIIGEEYATEWAIYSCSMLTHALANIAYIYPDKKDSCPELIAKMIEIVNTPTIRMYDTMQWKEDAMDTLDGKNSHMTYLSILSWMITNYKFSGGDERYDALLHQLIDTLVRRMHESKYNLNLLSFPHKPIWLTDMLVTIAALKNYTRLFNGRHTDTLNAWLENAKTIWIDPKTHLLAGLLPGASFRQKGIRMKGSCTALNCSYLSIADEDFAREQHQYMKQYFTKEADIMGTTIYGIKEYRTRSPKFSLAAGDAGLIIHGISAGGTAFALGSATYFGDWEMRYQLLRTAEIGGCTIKDGNLRHYKLGEFALVGEATALAMRTNINRNNGD
jgi:hypothetical protein